jgi:hypothetical protein
LDGGGFFPQGEGLRRGAGMAKFILGLLVGITIGLLSASYFSSNNLSDLTYKARAAVAKHFPVSN